MSTATLSGLRDYLFDTLSPTNLIWLGTQPTEYGRRQEESSLKPFTIEEMYARIAESERQIAAGLSQDSEEMFRELEEEFAREDKSELAEAV